ncbi:hypothetical protein [Undibacterium sp.]|jgi:hypothetical protein|uniref:GNAT family N-acetyltransferase n=1 Tax=Undibacterium sp. TaxID=1914977 RepID=UPI002C346859|nr:hypothetical protein [Undibacterium sp.]HTD04009.1 hypothetical protein [Undibacterium sp.]
MNVLTLETPRLILTQICQEDWSLFLELDRDPEVLRYISDADSADPISAQVEMHDCFPCL